MAKPDFVSSTRAPYAPIVMLIGAVAVVAVVISILNSGGEAEPLSGSPVGSGDPPVIVSSPITASGSIALLMPISAGGQTLEVGPAAFPPGSEIALTVELPAEESTSVEVGLSRLQDDGSLQDAGTIPIDVQPDADGRANVSESIDTLIGESGAGIYRVELRWQGDVIGSADVTLGMAQPANVAIFSEQRTVNFEAGTYTGVRVNKTGKVTDSKPYELTKASGAPAAAFANLNGEPHLLISAGVWEGYWVPVTEGVSLE